MRSRRVERRGPSAKLGNAHVGERALQLAPARGIERRLLEQTLEQRAQVQTGAADDQRPTIRTACVLDPAVGGVGPRGRRIAIRRVDEINALMRHTLPFFDRGPGYRELSGRDYADVDRI